MIGIGVDSMGVRKALMKAQVSIHKKNWSKTSLPTLNVEQMQTGLRYIGGFECCSVARDFI